MKVRKILAEKGGTWVLQEYVPNLLLQGGRKFHLRVHVVVAGRELVAVHDHVLVLLATLPLSLLPDMVDEAEMHKTNACQQGVANRQTMLLEQVPCSVLTLVDE
uniref:Uncharacterized protein n=1 Tax=Tetraselmis sp. GSL018 TaxID=582737 RepID=A0A061QTZ1_9CHLO